MASSAGKGRGVGGGCERPARKVACRPSDRRAAAPPYPDGGSVCFNRLVVGDGMKDGREGRRERPPVVTFVACRGLGLWVYFSLCISATPAQEHGSPHRPRWVSGTCSLKILAGWHSSDKRRLADPPRGRRQRSAPSPASVTPLRRDGARPAPTAGGCSSPSHTEPANGFLRLITHDRRDASRRS